MDELRLTCSVDNPDILIVTESWLNESHDSEPFQISGYDLFRQDRTGKSGDGVIIWIKFSLSVLRHFPYNSFLIGEHVFLRFELHSESFLFCATYIPPDRSADIDLNFQNFFHS